LIANVLSLGQFQKAQFTLALQQGVVDEVVARCIAAFRPALEAKSITVHTTAQAPRVVI
jgi:K+-sensing histidine kinase KdpD